MIFFVTFFKVVIFSIISNLDLIFITLFFITIYRYLLVLIYFKENLALRDQLAQ